MKAFVTDGDQRPALAITRALGARNISVVVGADTTRSLASSSRYCARHVTYPSPARHPEAFRHFLLDFVEREKIDVLLPVTDVTTSCAARHRDILGRRTALAVPAFEAFESVSDKWALLQRAAQCGVPIPRTSFVDGLEGLKDVVHRLEYPVVVKPARSRIPVPGGWIAARVHYAGAEADLWRLYQEHDYLATHPSLIQERITGAGVGMFVLFDHGRPVTAFGHRRLREKPPSGGVSVLRESVPVDPVLHDHAVRLLGPLGWHGVAMLEYKRDARTGSPFLMEVNGRFWGSLQLAIDAGVDFPYLVYRLARGEPLGPPKPFAVGVRSRWLLGDLDHLLLRLRKSDRALHLPDDAPSRVRALADFLRFSGAGLHYEVVSRHDPAPFRYELREYVRECWNSATAAVRRGAGRVAALA